MKSDSHYSFFRTHDLSELNQIVNLQEISVVIVNPASLQNLLGEFSKIRKQYPSITWVAISYSYIDPNLNPCFNTIISLNDSRRDVAHKLHSLIESNNCTCSDQVKEELTDREIDVLKLLVEGYSNKEISSALNISIHTVVSHRKNIVRKTGIKSLSGLVIYAITSKIVPIEPK